jgi:hypothetical protein
MEDIFSMFSLAGIDVISHDQIASLFQTPNMTPRKANPSQILKFGDFRDFLMSDSTNMRFRDIIRQIRH